MDIFSKLRGTNEFVNGRYKNKNTNIFGEIFFEYFQCLQVISLQPISKKFIQTVPCSVLFTASGHSFFHLVIIFFCERVFINFEFQLGSSMAKKILNQLGCNSYSVYVPDSRISIQISNRFIVRFI